MVHSMLDPNPDKRPSAQDLLENNLQTNSQLEMVWMSKKIKLLENKLKSYEEKFDIKRNRLESI